MEDITYDEEGNPVVRRPPRGPKKTRRSGSRDFLTSPTSPSKSKLGQPVDDPGYVNSCFNESASEHTLSSYSGGLSRRSSRPNDTSGNEVHVDKSKGMTAIFEVNGQSCDVILEDGTITWNHISGSNKALKGAKSKSFIKRIRQNSGKSSRPPSGQINSVRICDILGARIKRLRRDNQAEGEGICEGVAVHTYDVKGECRFKERTIVLGHPSEDLCQAWINRILKELEVFQERPRRLKVFVQPYAGGKTGRSIYSSRIKPLFAAAGCKTDVIEVLHNEHIKHEMIHFEVDDYDSVVSVGGDGTVSKVVTGLLSHSQSQHGIEITPSFVPVRASLPVGIVPVGSVNQICHSVMGTEDPETAAIHIILGHQQSADVCSLFQEDKFERFAFLSHYGFFGSVLPFLDRYQRIGDSKLEAAFVKALTKAKFRPYECEIQILPSFGSGDPKQGIMCRKRCRQCQQGLDDSRGSRYSDVVEELDPLAQSSTSSTIMDLSKETPWQTVKGQFLSVSLLSLPGLSSMAPCGMSKFTHLNDGCLDLVLVRSTAKKEFVRYLRRHGNQKNQLDFPFVETYRCKEVRFRARFELSWQHKDYNFSEIDYEVKRQETVNKVHRSKSMIDVVDDLDSEESDEDFDNDFTSLRNGSLVSTLNSESSGSVQVGKETSNKTKESKKKQAKNKMNNMEKGFIIASNNEINHENDTCQSGTISSSEEIDEKHRHPQRRRKKQISSGEHTNEEENGTSENGDEKSSGLPSDSSQNSCSNSRSASRANSVIDVSKPTYRPTLIEQERARRARSVRKRDEKKKAKAEKRTKSIWNIDNSASGILDLDFRIHHGLVTFHGQGIPVEYEPDEVRHGCLAVFRA